MMKDKKYYVELGQGEFIEPITDFKQSAFSDLYRKAYGMIGDIIEEDERKERKEKGNLLAFLGDRGSGKTTAMLSFLNSLEKDCPERQELLKKKADFIIFDEIDASMLESGEDLFEIILADMLMKLHEYEQENHGSLSARREYYNDEAPHKQELHRRFEDMYRSVQGLKRINGDDGLYSSPLSSLKTLSISCRLKNDFSQLVEKYIKAILAEKTGNRPYEQTYLIFAIDDLDMNIASIKKGFEMLGQIHRYLLVPNVIVLIASKFEQLEILGEKSFSKMFPDMHREMEYWKVEYLKQTSTEYLEKMVPIYHRLYMPSLENEISEFRRNLYIKKENANAKKVILGKISRRVGVFFDGNSKKMHYLEPLTMRGLNDYYCFLNELPKPWELRGKKSDEDFLEQLLYNYEKFINDVINRFAVERLGVEEREEFKQFCAEPSEDSVSYILRYAKGVIHKEQSDKKSKEINLKRKYGDMLWALSYLQNGTENNKKLSQCLITIFSLMLNKELYRVRLGSSKEKEVDSSILEELLPGSWVSFWADEILPPLLVRNESMFKKDFLLERGDIRKTRLNQQPVMEFNVPEMPKQENIVEWMMQYDKEIKSLEVLLFFFEEFYDEKERKSNLDLSLTVTKNEDGTFKLQIRINNAFADFNVLGFIKNTFYYRNKLSGIHIAIVEAFYKYWMEKGENAVSQEWEAASVVGEYETNTKDFSLLGEFERWETASMKKTGGKQQGMVVPVQHVEIYLNLLKNTALWSKHFFQNQNPVARAWVYLGEICSHMKEYLSDVEGMYDSDKGIFTESFTSCPIIECILDYQKKELVKEFPEYFVKLLKNCNRFYEGKDNSIMKDQIQLGTDPDINEVI